MTQSSTQSSKPLSQPEVKPMKEFREFYNPQTDVEKMLLKESILKDGCREPLVVWKQKEGPPILLDGYHRYDICKEHKISYTILGLQFKDKDEAKFWMWNNQRARRNITNKFQRIEVVLKIKDKIAAEAKKRQIAGAKGLCEQFEESVNTNVILGKMAGASHVTVDHVAFILEKYKENVISKEEIDALRDDSVSIDSIYQKYKNGIELTPKPSMTAKKWGKMAHKDKNTYVRTTFDTMVKKKIGTKNEQEFAKIVKEWAEDKLQ